jgi:hypothetical protein
VINKILNNFDKLRKLFPNKSEKGENDIENHMIKLHHKVRSNNENKLWQDLFCVQVTVLILVGMTCLLGMTQSNIVPSGGYSKCDCKHLFPISWNLHSQEPEPSNTGIIRTFV